MDPFGLQSGGSGTWETFMVVGADGVSHDVAIAADGTVLEWDTTGLEVGDDLVGPGTKVTDQSVIDAAHSVAVTEAEADIARAADNFRLGMSMLIGEFNGNLLDVGRFLLSDLDDACVAALGRDLSGKKIPRYIGIICLVAGSSRVINEGLETIARAKKAARGGAKVGGRIAGYTKHGLDQAIGRNGGKGVSQKGILDAVRNPTKVIEQAGGTTKYVGKDATVILNGKGKVVTTWGRPRNPVPNQ
jgi:hypothetical protein